MGSAREEGQPITAEEINAAIADGFTYPSIPKQFTRHIPDYYHDLNAIQEVVAGLDGDTARGFIWELTQVVDARFSGFEDLARMANATAAQRCEAYLRTVGKWKD
jgi:hypothetical protein